MKWYILSLSSSISILGGLFLGTLFGDILLCFILLIFFVILCFLFFFRFPHLFPALFLVVFFFGFGLFRGYSSFQYVTSIEKSLIPVLEKTSTFEGYIVALEASDTYSNDYTMKLVKVDGKNIEYSPHYILRLPKNFSLEVGEYISHKGKAYAFEDFEGFAYKNYMQSRFLFFRVSSSFFERVPEKRKENSTAFFSKARELFLLRISQYYPQEEALLLGGILVGARAAFPQDLKDDFNASGLTHFIAVSGLNITLCILFFTRVFSFLPSPIKIPLLVLFLILFCLFVGLGIPVIRATIMGIMGYIITAYGKKQNHILLFLFSALILGFWNPLSLVYDVSFHLSFGAVLGIISFQHFFKRLFFFLPEIWAIREATVLTFSALTFTLPIMMFDFGQISIIAPLANIAVTWTIPYIMFFGALSVFLGTFSENIALYSSYIPWIFLHYDILMVRFFGNLEYAVLLTQSGWYANYAKLLAYILISYAALIQKKEA